LTHCMYLQSQQQRHKWFAEQKKKIKEAKGILTLISYL
jgi:hypothetical protein